MSEIVPATRDRILEAALLAMGRGGPRRLTMSDVSEKAGLSRGTVYRYFQTKEDLLAVLAEWEQDRFSDGLRNSLAGIPEDERTIEMVAEYIISYLRNHPALTLMIDVEPEFVMIFLRRQLPIFHRITEELLAPVVRKARPVEEGWVTPAELNELLVRLVISVFLVPGEGDDATVGALEGALESFVRLASGRTPARSSAARRR